MDATQRGYYTIASKLSIVAWTHFNRAMATALLFSSLALGF